MTTETLDVFLDRNDATWTSQRYYVESLAEQFRDDQRVRVVDDIGEADVVHLNYLNPLGRVIHGKNDRKQHLSDVVRTLRGNHVPVVVTEHGVEEFSDVGESMFIESNSALQSIADGTKRKASRLLASRVDAIISISSMDRRYLIEAGIDPESVHHVPHGVNEEFLNASSGTESDFVLHVSKYSPHKNPEALIQVARQLETTFKIVGKGWRDNYGKGTHGDELAAIPNVDILGYVSKERLIELYTEAKLFYFPSIYEPFGLPILEAMACETPVVASRYSAGPDLCENSISLVDPEDFDSHRKAITRLLKNDQLRKSRGELAGKCANNFTWSSTASSTFDVYQQLVST